MRPPRVTLKEPHRFEHLPEHNHQLVIYESRDEQFDSVIPFIREGLGAGERCLVALDSLSRDQVIAALRERDVDVDAALASRQLSFENAADLYLPDESFAPESILDQFEAKIAKAEDAGFTGLRTTAEMTWAAGCDIDADDLKTYERKVEEFFQENHFVGQCQYRRSAFSEEFLCDVLQHHPRVGFEGDGCSNCYYKPPTEHVAGVSADSVNRKLETITHQQDLADSLDHREQCLSVLSQLTDQIREADPSDVEDIAGNLIAEIVEPSLIAVCQHERGERRLETQVLANTLEAADTSLIENLNGLPWQAFVDNEVQEFTVDGNPPIVGTIMPIGHHGVFLVATSQRNLLTGMDLNFLEAVSGHTEAALDQKRYEQQLERRHRELSQQRDHVERINRVNTVIRDIIQSLVEATTEDEVIRTVCELLVRKDCAEFVWYGEYEAATESVYPKQQAGNGQGYLDALSLEERWDQDEPSGRTARTDQVTTYQNIFDGRPLSHWQEQALKREFESMISLPVSYDNSTFGVVSLYDDRPDSFDEDIATVLDELSDCIAYALNCIRRKQALVTREVLELQIRVSDTALPIVEFVDEHDCLVEIEDVVSAKESGFRVFMDFTRVSETAIREFAVESPKIERIEFLSEGDRRHRAECKITDQCVIATLLNHNAVPQSVRAEDGEAHLLIRLRQDQDVRGFIEMFQSSYPSAEVVKRRNRLKPLRKVADVESQLERNLTERQLEILKLAYRSGYFERPRKRTAEDLAHELDVTHPTVSRHLREAERRIFSLIFEDG